MSTQIGNQITVNTFTGVFLVLAGTGTFIMGENPVTSLIIALVGVFFLTRAFAQRRSNSE